MTERETPSYRRADGYAVEVGKPGDPYQHWSAYRYQQMAEDVARRCLTEGHPLARVVAPTGEVVWAGKGEGVEAGWLLV